jgi:RNA-directed DNA polymerase
VSHAWLLRFVEYRIGDKRVVRLIQQWLKAGVLAEGRWTQTEESVPQGGSLHFLQSGKKGDRVLDEPPTYRTSTSVWSRVPGGTNPDDAAQ